jgi:hypothetical protein
MMNNDVMWDINGREVHNVIQTDEGILIGQLKIEVETENGDKVVGLTPLQVFDVLYPTTPAYVHREEISGLKRKKRSLASSVKSLKQEHERLVKLNDRQRRINKRLINDI